MNVSVRPSETIVFNRLGKLPQGVAERIFPGKASVSIHEAHAAFAASEDPLEKAALQQLLLSHESIGAVSTGDRASVASRAAETQAVHTVDEGDQKILDDIGKFIVGQDGAKQDILRFIKALRSKTFDPKPKNLMISGPPGVGKTEMMAAIAYAVYGDPTKFIHVKGGELQDTPSFAKVFGGQRGYVGYQENETTSPLAPDKLEAMFGEGPKLILWDEVDKIGGANTTQNKSNRETLQGNFWTMLTTPLEGKGPLTLNNGQEIDIQNSINVFTTNAGHDTANGKTGEALREHYIAESKKGMPSHMPRRIRNFTAADPLTQGDMANISEIMLKKKFATLEEAARSNLGADISLSASPETHSLLGRIGYDTNNGAGPLGGIVDDLLAPLMEDQLVEAADGNRYVLEPTVTEEEEKQMVAAFAKSTPSIPREYANSIPMQLRLVNPAQNLAPYAGDTSTLRSEVAKLSVLSSGAVGGQGFVILNKMEKGAPNEFHLLKPGATDAADRFTSVALPPELAQANYSVDAVSLDANRLLLTSLHAPSEGGDAVASTFIYDAGKREFTPVAAPPIPLVGAGLGAVDGKAVMLGGRPLYHDNGEWSVSQDVSRNGNVPSAAMGFIYDPAKNAWDSLSEGDLPPKARSGYAVAEHEGKVYFIGGEESALAPNGKNGISVASRRVDIYDSKTGRFETGPELKSPTAYATAVVDPNGVIQVLGGIDLLDNRSIPSPKSLVQTFNPSSQVVGWKIRKDNKLPTPAAQLSTIPHPSGYLVGPFYDGLSFDPNFQLLG